MIIDNETRTMVEKFHEVLKYSEKIDIAVDYFFVNGFAHIMDHLDKIEKSNDPDHIIRILTSFHTDTPTIDALLAANESDADVERLSSVRVSLEQSVIDAKDRLKSEMEYMPQTKTQRKAIRKLIEMIRKKKIELRIYTKEQLHAKLYLFRITGHSNCESIIGSSNFSTAGLKTHPELNFVTLSKEDYEEFLEWFNRHWDDDDSLPFTAAAMDVFQSSWAGKTSTPVKLAGKVSIHENPDSRDVDPGTIQLYDFQTEAVSKATKKINDYGGVIIADVVGTGKTYMGAAVLSHLLAHDVQYPLVICPARLKSMWEIDIKQKYNLPLNVISNSMLDDLPKYNYCDAILIDESHAFKDDKRVRFEKLLEYMESKTEDVKIIMLTATPISNSVFDLRNQLKLFPFDMMEKIPPLEETESSANKSKLETYFEGMDQSGIEITKEDKDNVRELLKYVLIRRTRKRILEKCSKDENGNRYMLKGDERGYFPKLTLNTREYDADITYEGKFKEIESIIRELTMGRYTAGKYVLPEYTTQYPYDEIINLISLGGIVRVALLKRLESSIKAFYSSVKRYRNGHKWFLQELEDGNVAVGEQFHEIMRKLIDNDTDNMNLEGELIKDMKDIESNYSIEAFDVERWKDDIRADMGRFDDLIRLLGMDESNENDDIFTIRDDKLHELLKLVNSMDEKLLIFTESAVTAKYLYAYLQKNIRGRKIMQLDSSKNKSTIDDAVKRFAPEYNGAEYPTDQQIDIMISTDILSEGLNLQSSRILINYDFHWNPVRLIQRNGRIDRLIPAPKDIKIFNFLTTPDVEKSLKLRSRVSERIRTIRDIIGTGTAVLEENEPPDEDDVCDIYVGTDSVFEPRIGANILDFEDVESEKLAESIQSNLDMKNEYEKMQFGIRAATGRDRMFVACSADDIITGIDGQVYGSTKFRRYYEVTINTIQSIRRSTFLTHVMRARALPAIEEPPAYNTLIAKAWSEFDNDIKSSTTYVPKYRFQKYFDDELKRLTESTLQKRILLMRKFVTSRMIQQTHPHRDLIRLYKKRREIHGSELLELLEKIHTKHGKLRFMKNVKKPQILYSIMM